MAIGFLKMHGAGNDFVVIDDRLGDRQLDRIDMRKLADRHTGIGCDQLVLLQKPRTDANVFMRIINADGSEVGSCGNASRCVAWLLHQERGNKTGPIVIETGDGLVAAKAVTGDMVTIDMGQPRLEWKDIMLAQEVDTLHLDIREGMLSDPVAVGMGNPHMVFFVRDVNAVPLERLGPILEKHPLFPKRANVSIAQIESSQSINLRVWERGAGLTLACGTAACATLVAAHRRGLTLRQAHIKLPGGTLQAQWRESDNCVWMMGPVAVSFAGQFDPGSYLL